MLGDQGAVDRDKIFRGGICLGYYQGEVNKAVNPQGLQIGKGS